MLANNLAVTREQIDEFCRRHHIHRLSIFGSALRDDFGPESDVDLLVEFQPGHSPGWDIIDVEEDLSRMLGGRKVDLVNPRYLNRRLRDRVLESAELLYGEG